VRSHDSRALDLDDLITMPGCAKMMRAMTKLEGPAIAIMASPWDKEGAEARGFGHQSTRAPLVEHGTDFQR